MWPATPRNLPPMLPWPPDRNWPWLQDLAGSPCPGLIVVRVFDCIKPIVSRRRSNGITSPSRPSRKTDAGCGLRQRGAETLFTVWNLNDGRLPSGSFFSEWEAAQPRRIPGGTGAFPGFGAAVRSYPAAHRAQLQPFQYCAALRRLYRGSVGQIPDRRYECAERAVVPRAVSAISTVHERICRMGRLGSI